MINIVSISIFEIFLVIGVVSIVSMLTFASNFFTGLHRTKRCDTHETSFLVQINYD